MNLSLNQKLLSFTRATAGRSARPAAISLRLQLSVLREERTTRFFVELSLQRQLLLEHLGACCRRTCGDFIDDTLDVRIVGEALFAEDIACKITPTPQRHVGNRVFVTCQVLR